MLADVFDSLADILSPPFRRALAKTLLSTIVVLVVLWSALDALAVSFIQVGAAWLATALSILVGLGLVLSLVFLAAPVASVVAGFFLDEVAAIVESAVDPGGPPGRAAPFLQSLQIALRYGPISILVGLGAIIAIFIPGLGFAAWIAANAYLLGREYFELCALRFRDADAVRAMRRANAGRVFLYGLALAAFVAVPLVNLATPLFGAALMARLHKRLSLGA